METFAIYDVCVLHSAFLRSFLVYLAIQGERLGAFRAKWTGRIHQEWIGSVLRVRPEISRARLNETRRLMDAHVRGCRVKGYQRWEARLALPDLGDRHVLAAALACAANVIVTFNVRDFPEAALRPFGVNVAHPDSFTMGLLASGAVVAAAQEQRASMVRPTVSRLEYLEMMRRNLLAETAAALAADHAEEL
jgi:hypothetical protein